MNPVKGMTTWIYRDFNREHVHGRPESKPSDGFIGGIQVDVLTGHRLELMIEGLHSHDDIEYPCGQADMHVTVDPACDLYDAILAVLDRLTADHQYKLKGRPYQDFVLCSDALVKSHTELCRKSVYPDAYCYMGGYWMDFTRETLAYVDRVDPDQDDEPEPYSSSRFHPSEDIVIRGEVRPGPTPIFTYDAPIVSRDAHPRYYALTRGKIVWDVAYNDVFPKTDIMDSNFQGCKSWMHKYNIYE
jgi:hypothetical protein